MIVLLCTDMGYSLDGMSVDEWRETFDWPE